MTKVFLFHGSNGNPKNHWFPWLKEELEKRGAEVFTPQFPIGKEGQTLSNWLEALKPFEERLEGSILIGHSLGCPFILNVLNTLNVNIKAAFLVAGFEGKIEAKEPNLNDFSDKDFDWDKIKAKCKKFYEIHSDNDPYVSLELSERLANKLNAEVVLVKNGGHFQSKSGFDNFELLLEKVESEL
jgi:uncharacterized protein